MSNLNRKLFSAADSLRNKMDASEYKDYLLGLIFYKYLSEKQLRKVVEMMGESLVDYDTSEKQLKLFNEVLDVEDDDSVFSSLHDSLDYYITSDNLFTTMSDNTKNGTFQLNDLKKGFLDLVSVSPQLEGLFDSVDLSSNKLGSDIQQRNVIISEVIGKLDDIDLFAHGGDVIGDAYEYLISEFASSAGKKGGEFYTPQAVSDMMARIVTLGKKDDKSFTVYDPTMGSGSLMLNVRKYLDHPRSVRYHGQEMNTTTFNLAKMNMILHDVSGENMKFVNGDTLSRDYTAVEPFTYDAVLMNPPYSAKWSSDKAFESDPRFDKFSRLAPKGKADLAFLLHGYYHLEENGTMAIVLPHGVLFRGGAEKAIREDLLNQGAIEAVIGLPVNLFFGTSIPTTILVLKRNRDNRDVMFIDASQDFEKGKNQNILTEENINKVIEAYKNKEFVDKYANLVKFDEIKENEFNLNIPRYVDTFEEPEPIDLRDVITSIKDVDETIKEKEAELLGFLNQMVGIDDEMDQQLEAFRLGVNSDE